ncbi:MAG TPA: hypothetical protein VIM73_01930, partial [Polyangiaceae bacterium]
MTTEPTPPLLRTKRSTSAASTRTSSALDTGDSGSGPRGDGAEAGAFPDGAGAASAVLLVVVSGECLLELSRLEQPTGKNDDATMAARTQPPKLRHARTRQELSRSCIRAST